MEKKALFGQLSPKVIKEIQDQYIEEKIVKTNDCKNDMIRDGLFEADVEKVIMDATIIEKVMSANSPLASNPLNTHYVIPGVSTQGIKIYCKICTNYHPETNEFIGWALTSFCISK